MQCQQLIIKTIVERSLSNDDFYILSALYSKVKVFIQINSNFRFDGEKVLLLVESPQDALRLILGGIAVSRINIGSLSFDSSKKMISDTVAVSQQDIQAFQLLHQHGIQLEIRKVSSDSPKNLWQTLINKHLITE